MPIFGLADLDSVTDRLRRPIDEGIKPLVGAMWSRGIGTTASCEGHADHGSPYPWVAFENAHREGAAALLTEWHAGHKDERRVWCIIPGIDHSYLLPFHHGRPLAELIRDALDIAEMVLIAAERGGGPTDAAR